MALPLDLQREILFDDRAYTPQLGVLQRDFLKVQQVEEFVARYPADVFPDWWRRAMRIAAWGGLDNGAVAFYFAPYLATPPIPGHETLGDMIARAQEEAGAKIFGTNLSEFMQDLNAAFITTVAVIGAGAAIGAAAGGTAGAGAAAGEGAAVAGGGVAAGEAATAAALVESGTVGVAGAALEASALAGTAAQVGTVAGAELAALVESGTVGIEGAALEAAALSGESVAFSTATGEILASGASPGLPGLEPSAPEPQAPQTTPQPKLVTDAVKSAVNALKARLAAALAPGGDAPRPAASRPVTGPAADGDEIPLPALLIAGLVAAFVVMR